MRNTGIEVFAAHYFKSESGVEPGGVGLCAQFD
jgi:hypothetical protein